MSLKTRIERLEEKVGTQAEDLVIFVFIHSENAHYTEKELEQLEREAVDKNPGQRAYVIRA